MLIINNDDDDDDDDGDNRKVISYLLGVVFVEIELRISSNDLVDLVHGRSHMMIRGREHLNL